MGKDKNKKKQEKYPYVSVCTPTFNRRPFVPMMLQCFSHQTYPKDRIEWIIIDDGTDKIEDLVSHIAQVKYLRYDTKLTLGKKRNIMNEQSKGDIIIYMDDDDYYPPERISHAVDMLQKNPKALCAGSSAMFIYFKHINKMLLFGPYGEKHATAATFAFRKELLKQTKFEEDACLAEEKRFLHDYTIPFVQLDPKKSILVFSHNHNTFDKKELLNQGQNPFIHETTVTPHDIIKEPEILQFFMEDIDIILDSYEIGKTSFKPDVVKQLAELKEKRTKQHNDAQEQQQKQLTYNDTIHKITRLLNPQDASPTPAENSLIIRQLTHENSQLKDKVKYLETKIMKLIQDRIKELKEEQKI